MSGARRGRATTSLVLLVSSAAGAALLEGGLAAFAPIEDPYAARKSANGYVRPWFEPGTTIVSEVESVTDGGTAEVVKFRLNDAGFRGRELHTPKPLAELRVFLIGGSTIEGLHVAEEDAIGRTIERTLGPGRGIVVQNAGRSGHASDDHVSLLAHRIVHLEPDVVVVVAGANDLFRAFARRDPLHRETPPGGFATFAKLLATELQIGRRLHLLTRRAFRAPRRTMESIHLRSDYAAKAAARRSLPVGGSTPPFDTRPFERNLRSLVGICRAHGILPVLATHPSSWGTNDPMLLDRHWMTTDGSRALPPAEMSEALERMNEVTRAVAEDMSVPLVGLAGALEPAAALFRDDMHFTPEGTRRAGGVIAEALVPVLDAVPSVLERGPRAWPASGLVP